MGMFVFGFNHRRMKIGEKAVHCRLTVWLQTRVEQSGQAVEATCDNDMADQANRNNQICPFAFGQF